MFLCKDNKMYEEIKMELTNNLKIEEENKLDSLELLDF